MDAKNDDSGDDWVQLRSALLSPDTCEHPNNVSEAMGYLKLEASVKLSAELQFLKRLKPREPQPTKAVACGLTLFSLENYPSNRVLELSRRPSKLYFERDFYANLYDVLTETWANNEEKKIVLTGNTGVGKSWFQVYLLCRLLAQTPDDRPYRFVVRHVGKNFYFMDLESASGYTLIGPDRHITTLLSDHGSILYLYEPAACIDQPPMVSEAPCLASLLPRKKRIKEYRKEHPHMFYSPVAEYNELECIAEEENLDLDFLKKNFDMFGGIFRHTLVRTPQARKEYMDITEARCTTVTADMLRSIAADIDDDPTSALEGNISGFVLSYTDIKRHGDGAFSSPGLTLTSHYVRQRIMDKMSFASNEEHLKMLAKVLKGDSRDPTGKDLEASVVQMLAAGPGKVRWQYRGVSGETDITMKMLGHTKREINRGEFDDTLVNYPRDTSFPLADCVLAINNEYWAFQTTWQNSHAFLLRTLRSFRELLKLPPQATLNLLFVNPARNDTYERRHRDKYLAKGEDPHSPILDSKKNVLMTAADVARMWENTRIFVAFPKDKDWHKAIKTLLGVKDL